MKLGAVLEAYRQKHDLTYRELADEIGIDHCALFRLENAPTSGTESALKLMNWLLGPQPQKKTNVTRTKNH